MENMCTKDVLFAKEIDKGKFLFFLYLYIRIRFGLKNNNIHFL